MIFCAILVFILLISRIVKLNSSITANLACFILLVSLSSLFWAENLYLDNITKIGSLIIYFSLLVIIQSAQKSSSDYERQMGSMLLSSIVALGALVAIGAHHWMELFLALQCMSIPTYALIKDIKAASKYLILSSVAMSFFLFGMLLLYTVFGTLNFSEQINIIGSVWAKNSNILYLAIGFISIGFLFKLSVFPFHAWAPIVFKGSEPFLITLINIVIKTGVILSLTRVWFLLSYTQNTLSILAILSMWLGSVMLLSERNIFKFLAYLSISHISLLFMPIISNNIFSTNAILIDLLAFSLALFLFLYISKLFNNLEDLSGLYNKYPSAALILSISLISMAGFPLTVGFIGKYSVLLSGLKSNLIYFMPHIILSNLIILFTIFRIISSMFSIQKSQDREPILVNKVALLGLFALVAFGITPEIWLKALF